MTVKEAQDTKQQSLTDRAREYIKQRRYREAIEIFDVESLTELESLLHSIRSELPYEEAKEIIDLAVKTYRGSPGVRSELGWLYYSDEQYEEAEKIFDDILKRHQNHAPTLHGKMASLRLMRRFQEAEKLSERAREEQFKGHFGIQSERGWLYSDQRQYDEAAREFIKISEQDSSAFKWIISCLRSQRRFREAQDWIEKAFKIKPNDIEIINEEGWFLFDQKQYAAALARFSVVLEIDEKHEFALQGKIASLRLLRRFSEAEESIRVAQQWHPRSSRILSERGWLLVAQQQYNKALESFDLAVRLFPNRIALKFEQVDALIAMNHGFEAVEVLKALKNDFEKNSHKDLEIIERLGRLYLRRNDLKSAEKAFREILDFQKDNILGLNGLGAVYFAQARYEDAAVAFSRVVEKDPKNPLAYTNLARALVRQEDSVKPRWRSFEQSEFLKAVSGKQRLPITTRLERAEENCRNALKLDPKSPPAYGCLGIIAFERENLHESEELFQTSIEMDPQEGSYRDLGALFVLTKRYDEAEAMLKKALEKNKDDAAAHLELGYLYIQTEKIEQAMREFHQAMVVDPNNDEPPRALATILMRNHRYEEAEDVLRKAIRNLAKNRRWQVHLTLARLLIQRGEETEDSHYYDEALMEVKKSKRLKPDHGDPYFHAGIILAKQKDYRSALKNFRWCLSRNKNHYEAELNKRRVQSHLRKERSGSYFWGGFCVGVLSLSQLILLWVFFSQNKVTATILSFLIPILVGLVVVGFLMPGLIKLKVAGLEVGIIEQKEPIYHGPKGEVGFSISSPTISSGPR